ncbi:MlaA family lipoprotein [Noviherbaspirillum galbum]|uniref:VacJ family lipoprotein n=1 Tax=Noviherbaspirillum galbum TaxID=2709383 RepID=A0A6B3SKC3_9BURK|nr:VacJ family lipoprotein [Noviherbaspirillum galbum]NEX61304.1 VacJ family lipoprotein [Noviherbaspirillum galbum]
MNISNRAIRVLALAAALALAGCATNNPKDPLEPFNRAVFSFNDKLDKVAIKPAAEVYSNVLPSWMQTAVGNFFGNLSDVGTAMNNFLQGKLEDGMNDVMRVAVNTTLGLGGLLDIGSEAGIPKHREDFGQTLGKWGVASGPYIVLPGLGSSTLRDSLALPVDIYTDPWAYEMPVRYRNTGTAVRLIDQRAVVLDAATLIEEAAIDKYEFVRDAYLQRRESKIHDGETKSRSSSDDDVGPTAEMEPPVKVVIKEEQNGGGGMGSPLAKEIK